MRLSGPRGTRLFLDSSDAVPLVFFQIAIAGGAAGDPAGMDGFIHHLAVLMRRGAGERDRRALDLELDALGASLEVSTSRDAVKLTGLCLRRNLDHLVAITADILARPHLAPAEHDKLLRETRMSLDEIRDDDAGVANRFFNRECVPGHPYGRTIMGTEASLAKIDLDEIRRVHRRLVVPQNLIIGFAGAIGPDEAVEVAGRLIAGLPDDAAQPLPAMDIPEPPAGRRILIVDKPERVQAQILLGHLGPAYGSADTLAFTVVETVFGGMFSSRLMQEVRVKRGWSYGASASLQRSRGPHWFSIYASPAIETAGEALALVWTMLADLARDGITREEFAFAKSYLEGSMPFRLATPRQRVRIAVKSELFGLPEDYVPSLPQRLETVTWEDACRAAARWIRPDDALAVMVATAETLAPHLDQHVAFDRLDVAPFDSY